MNDASSSGSRGQDFALLDLLRWVSACFVAIAHARNLLFLDYGAISHSNPFIAGFYALTGLGHEAVVVFFVLSGYLVGGGLAQKTLNPASLSDYFIHRFSRIYIVLIPALAMTLLLDLGGAQTFPTLYRQPGWASSLEFSAADRDGFGTLVCNALNLQDAYCQAFGSNGPLWSLAYEWFYYMSFPFLLAAARGAWTRRFGSARPVLCAAIFLLLAYLCPVYLFFFPIWLMGLAARLLCARWKISAHWAYAALVGAFIMLAVSRAPIAPTELTDYGIGFAIAVLLSSSQLVASVRVLRELNATIAGYSYSLYVIHYPILVFSVAVLVRTGLIEGRLAPSATAFGLFAIGWALVYAAAWLFSLGTERQTGRLRRVIAGYLARMVPSQGTAQRDPNA